MKRVAHFLRVEGPDGSPDLIAFCIEINKGRGEFKSIHRREFLADVFLNIQPNYMDLVAQFCFQLVNDGLNRCAAYSIGGLKFEQDRRACADHLLHQFGVVHEGRLARVQDDPRAEQRGCDHSEGKKIIPLRLVCQQNQAGNSRKGKAGHQPEITQEEHQH